MRLRPYRITDTERFFVAAVDSYEHVHRFGQWLRPDWKLQDAAGMIQARVEGWQEDTDFSFVIENPQSGAFLGDCGLSQVDRTNQRANLGYWTRTGWTGRGIASEAARLVAQWGLTTAGLHRIEILIAAGNAPSLGVARKVDRKSVV